MDEVRVLRIDAEIMYQDVLDAIEQLNQVPGREARAYRNEFLAINRKLQRFIDECLDLLDERLADYNTISPVRLVNMQRKFRRINEQLNELINSA